MLICGGGADSSAQSLRSAVPEGFEALEEPQTVPVDVYFGGRSIGSVVATFAPGWVELVDPGQAVAGVDAVLPDRRAMVVDALRGRLATNTGLSCLPDAFPGCGTLDVPIAGVIFNPDFFRLDLVIARPYLAVQEMVGRYLTDPVTGPSALANLVVGGVGRSNDDNSLIAGMDGRLSHGRSALHLSAYAQTQSNRPVVDALAGEYFGQDHLIQLGYIEDYPTRFSRVPGLLGARIETYLDTRLDRDTQSGTPILLFLTERSQVEILRDGRLVGARSYEAGNQRIDTGMLPRGVYDVTLRIRGASGAVQEQTITFVKDPSLPPPGEWQYFAQLGMVTEDDDGGFLPSVATTPLAKLGVARRLSTAFALSTAVGATDRTLLGEIDVRHLTPQTSSALYLAGSSAGGVGIAAATSLRLGRFAISLSGDIVLGSEGTDRQDDWDDETEEDRRWEFGNLEQSRQSVTLSAGYGWTNGANLQFRGYYRNRDDEDWGIGPLFSMPIGRTPSLRTDLEFSATRGDDESLVFGRIRFTFAPPGRPYRLTATAGTRYREVDRDYSDGDDGGVGLGMFGGLRASYDLENLPSLDATVGVEAARDVDGNNRLGVDATANAPYGSASGAVSLEEWGGRRSIVYQGFARTIVAANLDGAALGGRGSGDAAILAEFDGPAEAGRLTVSAGQGDGATVRTGSSVVLPVPSFRSYTPSASSADANLLDLKQEGADLPLYPGNVATARWQVRRLVSFYGRLLHQDGRPVANARILDINGLSTTDNLGYFVAEVEEFGDHDVTLDGRTTACTITLAAPDEGAETDVISLGDVTCR
ncbi:MAG TPA: TcfC E-set like domain-containing protein [Geminicoccus sp.]|uniref:TcfC E-set like domain-containing protein n=1 Tax=Geminicoccus sp. TaxID=2024832 RepID=UPI002CF7DC0A|nr:TcfC E-set like domain-containing protein [Geminicoccus sp.]HWL67641.1 TcfC E-set like domain-containing protein [Geminicoccus sp.]